MQTSPTDKPVIAASSAIQAEVDSLEYQVPGDGSTVVLRVLPEGARVFQVNDSSMAPTLREGETFCAKAIHPDDWGKIRHRVVVVETTQGAHTAGRVLENELETVGYLALHSDAEHSRASQCIPLEKIQAVWVATVLYHPRLIR